MIVLSVGMPKSGSAWYYNMTNDLLVSAGYQDARDIRQKFHLHSTLKYTSCVWAGSRLHKSLVLLPHFCGNTFVIKSHAPPSRNMYFLMRMGIMKATFIYRDPRDIALSAFERGKREHRSGKTSVFTELYDLEQAINFVYKRLVTLNKWFQHPYTLITCYETLVTEPVTTLKKLARFLNIEVSSKVLKEIVVSYQPQNLANLSKEKGDLHFNKGVVGRFYSKMTEYELNLCQRYFGEFLEKMGYELS